MTIDILTIFPEYFTSSLTTSVLGKAIATEKIEVNTHSLRDFGVGNHSITDDRPYGGGAGMVMLVEPIAAALDSLGYKKGSDSEMIILTSAKGSVFSQETARAWSELNRLCIICGHYEGVDERVAEHLIDAEVRIGDYVLTGGEPAAAVMIDAVARLLPGVLGNESSLLGESHDEPGVLGYPQYSRPEEINGWKVPGILLGGNHSEIQKWREDHRALRSDFLRSASTVDASSSSSVKSTGGNETVA